MTQDRLTMQSYHMRNSHVRVDGWAIVKPYTSQKHIYKKNKELRKHFIYDMT